MRTFVTLQECFKQDTFLLKFFESIYKTLLLPNLKMPIYEHTFVVYSSALWNICSTLVFHITST